MREIVYSSLRPGYVFNRAFLIMEYPLMARAKWFVYLYVNYLDWGYNLWWGVSQRNTNQERVDWSTSLHVHSNPK